MAAMTDARLDLAFTGPDHGRAEEIFTALTRTPVDELNPEALDLLLQTAAGSVDQIRAVAMTDAFLQPPVIDDNGLIVAVGAQGMEPRQLFIEAPGELLDELRALPRTTVTGAWIQAVLALHSVDAFATEEVDRIALHSVAAAVLDQLAAEGREAQAQVIDITDEDEGVGSGDRGRIVEVRRSWRDHGHLDIDQGVITALFALAVQVFTEALAEHGAEAILLPYEVAGNDLAAGYTTLENLETTGIAKTTMITPTDATVSGRLTGLTGGNANLANALWFDILAAAADHLGQTGTTTPETAAKILDVTGDCLAATELVEAGGAAGGATE